MTVQTILIPTSFTINRAIDWLSKHGFKTQKVDITKNFYRFRQSKPQKIKDMLQSN